MKDLSKLQEERDELNTRVAALEEMMQYLLDEELDDIDAWMKDAEKLPDYKKGGAYKKAAEALTMKAKRIKGWFKSALEGAK